MYQQLGFICRMLKDHEEGVKQYKKMLQLAWQEGDVHSEMTAYDCLSLEYYYLGEVDKCKYYHDRMTRGKMENSTSIVKKVTTNLLKSRRDQRHNKGELKDMDKQKQELQRLPSPSAMSKGS